MKTTSVLLLILLFGIGGPVKTLKTTSQEWVGGLRESGYGTDYRIILKTRAGSDQLQFGSLWVGDLHMDVRVTDASHPKLTEFAKGSEIILRAGLTWRPGPDGGMSLSGADHQPCPVPVKGAGVLSYTCKGKQKYMQINAFEQLDKIIYP